MNLFFDRDDFAERVISSGMPATAFARAAAAQRRMRAMAAAARLKARDDEERQRAKRREFQENWRQMVVKAAARQLEEAIAKKGPGPGTLSAKCILREVSEKHQIPVAKLVSDRRFDSLMPARRELCFRLRHETKLSWFRIGQFIRRDHSTAVHNAQKHEEWLNNAQSKGEAGAGSPA